MLKALTRSRSAANLRRQTLLSLRGAIGELRSQRRPRAGVDAERRRALGLQSQQIVGHAVEQLSAPRRRLAAELPTSRYPNTRSRAAVSPPMQAPQWLHVG